DCLVRCAADWLLCAGAWPPDTPVGSRPGHGAWLLRAAGCGLYHLAAARRIGRRETRAEHVGPGPGDVWRPAAYAGNPGRGTVHRAAGVRVEPDRRSVVSGRHGDAEEACVSAFS